MLINVFVSFANLIIKSLGIVAGIALSVLPPSPFKSFQSIDIPFLDTLNWVIPFSFMVTILGYWVGAISIYYIIQVVLRWVKVVE